MANEYGKIIIVESDNLTVNHVLTSVSLDLSYLVLIIKECQQLSCTFEYLRFVHIHREGNYVTHELAELTLNFEFMYSLS